MPDTRTDIFTGFCPSGKLAVNLHLKTTGMAKPEYIQKNREWLAAKALEDGVKPLDKGIYFKVLKSGRPGAPRPGAAVWLPPITQARP